MALRQVYPVHPLLKAERAQASFASRQLTFLLDGSEARTIKKERIRALVEADPIFRRDDAYFNDRETMYLRGLQKINRVQQRRRELNLDEEEQRMFKIYIGDALPTFLHDSVFVPNLIGQMDDEQKAKWVKKALDYEILGCYAQTELGHGSNVRGLETTATFLPASDEFEVNTPTLSSIKWWPGCMGKTANFAVVYARLLLPDGKDYGIHSFLVQIRSLEDHSLMPGVSAGDIGPKFATNTNDNGYLRLDRVRIPRDQMLMRFSKVSREGRYSTPPHAKLAYGTMVIVRATIVASAAGALAAAATIATRYSIVRTQGYKADSKVENSILDYRMQQYRLFPVIASAFALHFTGRFMLQLNDSMQKNMQSGDMSLLAEVHATSSGLKAVTTWIGAAGIEECRRACGGHGYLQTSGLPNLYAEYAQNVTVEGDNYLLTQQTGRYLLKMYEQGRQGKKVGGHAAYLEHVDAVLLEKCAALDSAAFYSPAVQIKAFQHRAALLVHQTATSIANDVAAGASFEKAWNNALVEIMRSTKAHCQLTIVINFINAVAEVKTTAPSLHAPLERLCHLFALHLVEQELGEFTEDGYLSNHQVTLVRGNVRAMLDAIRPDAVALVDAFNLSDHELNSALGRFDGRVYETLYEWAQQSPLNKHAVTPGYEEYLRPMFKREGPFAAKL